jgi:hypothetical protein
MVLSPTTSPLWWEKIHNNVMCVIAGIGAVMSGVITLLANGIRPNQSLVTKSSRLTRPQTIESFIYKGMLDVGTTATLKIIVGP